MNRKPVLTRARRPRRRLCLSPSLQAYTERSQKRSAAKRARNRCALRQFASMLLLVALVLGWPLYRESIIQSVMPRPKVLDSQVLQSEIISVLNKHGGTYGVYLKVLETGEEFCFNDGEYVAASCYKLPLALLVYKMASEGRLDLDSTVAFTREDWEGGTGVLQATRPGTELSIRNLVKLAVVESDNIAANMLLRKIGKQQFVDFHRSSGAKVIPVNRNVSSPRDMGHFAEQIIRFAREKPEFGHELLSYFLESRFKDRLPSRLPEDVEVANKIGTLPGIVNDVGIVIDDNVSYVLAVMSRDVDHPEMGRRAIADISLMVYRHVASRSETRLRGASLGKQVLEAMDG